MADLDPLSLVKDGASFLQQSPRYMLKYKDLQKKYMWEVIFLGSVDSKYEMTAFAQTTALPAIQREESKYYYKHSSFHYAGRDKSEKTIRITFFDDTKLTIYRDMHKWYQMCNYGDPIDYMRNIRMRLLKPNALNAVPMIGELFSDSESLVMDFKGAVLEGIDEVQLDYNGSEMVQVTVNIRYSEMVIDKGMSFLEGMLKGTSDLTKTFTNGINNLIGRGL